jgi:hypothetical protein
LARAPPCFVNLLLIPRVCGLALAFACALGGGAVGSSIEGITRTKECLRGLDE